MTVRNVLVFRAALALVLALVVVDPATAANPRGDRTPPTTPTNLRVTSLSQTSITLAWDPSTDKSGFSYSVNMNGLSFSVPQTQTTYALTSLSPGRTYTFYVTAVDHALNTSGRSTPSRRRRSETRQHPRPRSSRGPCEVPRRSR